MFNNVEDREEFLHSSIFITKGTRIEKDISGMNRHISSYINSDGYCIFVLNLIIRNTNTNNTNTNNTNNSSDDILSKDFDVNCIYYDPFNGFKCDSNIDEISNDIKNKTCTINKNHLDILLGNCSLDISLISYYRTRFVEKFVDKNWTIMTYDS